MKYHQNGTGNEYGADGVLTNNWNPSLDYGDEYVHVYFRINTPSYNDLTFNTVEDREAWENEASELIRSFGIMEDSGFTAENQKEKCPYLYAHPQAISGVVLKNDVQKIAEAINTMKLFSVRWVDLYETVYIMTDDEYNKYLASRKADIRKLLFEKSQTSRRTKYHYICDVMYDIAKIIRLPRLGYQDGKNYGDGYSGATRQYIYRCFLEMVEEGFLKLNFNDNGLLYVRSINKTEQKAFKNFVE